MRDRMLAGDAYIADDPVLAEESATALDLMAAYNATSVRQRPLRRQLLEALLGVDRRGHGDPATAVRRLRHATSRSAPAASRTSVSSPSTSPPITIGDDVQIGPNVQLLTPTHPVEPEPRRQKWEAAQPIVIGDNVWLGGGAIVLPGVTIGENTVVGAGSVVTRDLPANVVAVGNPARVVRSLEQP